MQQVLLCTFIKVVLHPVHVCYVNIMHTVTHYIHTKTSWVCKICTYVYIAQFLIENVQECCILGTSVGAPVDVSGPLGG